MSTKYIIDNSDLTLTEQSINGNLLVTSDISGTTFYGDGSNLTGISSSTNYGNVLFVDSTNGNDSTGTQNNFNKPYLSVGQAGNAAALLTPTAENRTLIYVRRGSYGSTNMVLKDYTDYYFEPGSVIFNVQIIDNSVSVSCNIFGKVKLLGGPLSVNESFRLTGTASKVYFEFDEFNTSRAAFGIFNGASATIVGRKVYSETFNTGYGSTFEGGREQQL